MAAPGKKNLITVVDLGSWKISALIAAVNDAGELEVLGTGQRESRGVRRGFVADMERTEAAIRETVEQAERVAGSNIEDVWVGFSGGNQVSDVVSAEHRLEGHRVEQADIEALLELAREVGWAIADLGRQHVQGQIGVEMRLNIFKGRLHLHRLQVMNDTKRVKIFTLIQGK